MQLGLHNTCSLKYSEMEISVFPTKLKHHQGFLSGIFISLFLNLDNVCPPLCQISFQLKQHFRLPKCNHMLINLNPSAAPIRESVSLPKIILRVPQFFLQSNLMRVAESLKSTLNIWEQSKPDNCMEIVGKYCKEMDLLGGWTWVKFWSPLLPKRQISKTFFISLQFISLAGKQETSVCKTIFLKNPFLMKNYEFSKLKLLHGKKKKKSSFSKFWKSEYFLSGKNYQNIFFWHFKN